MCFLITPNFSAIFGWLSCIGRFSSKIFRDSPGCCCCLILLGVVQPKLLGVFEKHSLSVMPKKKTEGTGRNFC